MSHCDPRQVILTHSGDNIWMNRFKERLRELREELGLMQGQLAEALNIPRATYSNWEQGRREPDIDGLVMLVNYFKVSAGYLIGTED